MSVVDSYVEANKDSSDFLYAGGTTYTGRGQSFTGNGGTLAKAQWYIRKAGTPPGNIAVNIYAHSGVFGTSSVLTGSALATADAVAASTLTTSFALVDFSFSGANQITLTNATKYVVTIEYSAVGSDNANYVEVGRDASSPTHGGNSSGNFGGWFAEASDEIFYIHDGGGGGSDPTPLRSLMGIGS